MMRGAKFGLGVATSVAVGTVVAKANEPAPVVRFGAIADIQCADIDDAYNFNKTSMRRYRGALDALGRAVDDWNGKNDLAFIVNLGDIIDQINETKGESVHCLKRVLKEFNRVVAGVPIWHLVGNHELYNFTRTELYELLPTVRGTSTGRTYHSFCNAGWRFVVIDGYDEHCITDRETPPSAEEAYQLLEQYNKTNVRAKRGTTNWSKGLSGLELRFMPFNGRIGEEQLEWLKGEMRAAKDKGERVVVFSHMPIQPGSSSPACLLWNYDKVLSILQSGNTAAVFAGHDHSGGYAQDAYGIHHITIPSPLHITPENPTAHATVELRPSCITIHGSGIVPSRSLPLQPSLAKL